MLVYAVAPPVKSSSATNGAAAGPPAEISTPPVPVPVLTVQVKVADPDAPVVSVAVTVTVDVPAVVGVPEISPDEELMDSPAGSPVAAVGKGLAGRGVARADLHAGRGPDGAGLVTGAGDRDVLAVVPLG